MTRRKTWLNKNDTATTLPFHLNSSKFCTTLPLSKNYQLEAECYKYRRVWMESWMILLWAPQEFANHKRLWALISIGRTYRDAGHNPGNMLSTPQLNNTLISSCHDVCQHCFCYEMDLLKPYQFDQAMLGAVNATGQKFITMYQTPFYHMRLVSLGGWDTNDTKGCKLYGCGGLSFLICASNIQTDEGRALFLVHKALSVKKYWDSDGNEQIGFSLIGHIAITHVYMERCYADFTFDLRSGNPVDKANESQTREIIALNASEYLKTFDMLYPSYLSPYEDTIACNFLVTTADIFYQSPMLAIEMMTFPWVQQQAHATSSNDSVFNATFSELGYKIVVARSSMQIFIVLGIIILSWCWVVLASSGSTHSPEVSAFPELDLVSRMQESQRFSEAASQLVERRPRDIADVLYGVNVQLYEMEDSLQFLPRSDGDAEALELQPRSTSRTELA